MIAGPTVDDGTFNELIDELRARHATIPIIAVGRAGDLPPLETLAYGAIEALADDETRRLGATMLRAIRDAGLGRALRAAHDELQGVLSVSDRHSSLLSNAPALLWSTDEALVLRGIEGAEARPAAIGLPVGDWDRTAPRRRPRARCRRASRRAGRRDDDHPRAVARPFALPDGFARVRRRPHRRHGRRRAGTRAAATTTQPAAVRITTPLPICRTARSSNSASRPRCASAKPASAPPCSSSMSTASRR